MDLIDDPVPGDNAPEFSVSEISGAIKRVLEGEFGRVRVRGEVGRVFKARSGHIYYDVKDDKNVLACTTWKGQIASLSVIPEEGLEVVVTGRLTSFGAQSKYNMNVDDVTVAGEGALMAMLEKRKKLLAAEGLFEDSRKKPLPYLPEVIGVITSPSGAVIRDILHRLRDRFPRKVLVWPVAVQGKDCAPQVARAVQGFNQMTPGGSLPRPDLLIVARGGGSIEDLWGFNEEVVARAVAGSDIPLISAVGHETDTTLIDFVSDQRAPTPTAAAELAVPVRVDLLAWLQAQDARLAGGLARLITQRKQRVQDLARALPRPQSLVANAQQRLDLAADRLPRALLGLVERRRAKLTEQAASLRPSVVGARIRNDRQKLDALDARRAPSLQRAIAQRRQKLMDMSARLRLPLLTQDLKRRSEDLKRISQGLSETMQGQLRHRDRALRALARLHQSLGYEQTLQRGYAVVRGPDGVITRIAQAQAAASLEIQFQDGRLPISAGLKPVAKRKPRASKDAGPDQGDLF